MILRTSPAFDVNYPAQVPALPTLWLQSVHVPHAISVLRLNSLQAMSSAVRAVPNARSNADVREHLATISGQSGAFFAGTIFTAGAGYLFKVYLARVLGAEALGIYTLGMTVVGFAGILGAMGLPQTAPRFVAMYKSTGQTARLAQFLWRGAALLLAANAAAGLVIFGARHWIATKLYHAGGLATFMPFFVAILLLGALNIFYGQSLGGYKAVAARTVITSFIGTSATIVLSILFIQMGLGLKGYLAAQVASAALVLLMLGFAVWRRTPAAARKLPVGLPSLQTEVLSFSAVLFGIQALEFVGAQADRILIGVYLNAREVGIYAVAFTVVAFIPILLQSVNQIFAPSIAELHALGQPDVLGRLYRTLTKWVFAATIPLALVVIVFSRPLMAIFGPEFEAGSVVLVIGVIGQLVNCGVGSVGQLLVMSGNQVRMVRTQAIIVPISLLLSCLLIPRYGLKGAAAAAAIGNVAMNLLWLRDVNAALAIGPRLKTYTSLAQAMAASLVCVVGIRYILPLQNAPLSILLALIFAYASFAAGAAWMGFDADDRALARVVQGHIAGLLGWK